MVWDVYWFYFVCYGVLQVVPGGLNCFFLSSGFPWRCVVFYNWSLEGWGVYRCLLGPGVEPLEQGQGREELARNHLYLTSTSDNKNISHGVLEH